MMSARDTKLVSKGKGRFINRPTKTGRKIYDKYFVYVPTEIARDSAFPFKDGDEVEIEVDTKRKGLLIKLAR